MPDIAAILIGRNEGVRLIACLRSVQGLPRVIYVDSGSTDGSVEAARGAGAEVIELDMTRPFTAARARNAGLAALKQGNMPEFVQFIDGDCELQPGWLDTARRFLETTPEAAVACGRRRERFPDASIYNRLCDREWDTPVGRAKACGGDALMRMSALEEVDGYNPSLIAGEEPEMCLRMRAKGWEIWRLDAEMTLHDAAMTRFGQFWKRAKRAGHAWAEGAAMHGAPPERHGVAQVRRALLWAVGMPLAILLLSVVISPWALLLVLVYPVQIARLAIRQGRGRKAWERAALLTIGKFAEALGVIDFHLRRMVGRRSRLIEYK